jgi:hypothetical protein
MAGPSGDIEQVRKTIQPTQTKTTHGKKRRFTMFKKKLVMLIAAALMTLTASSAFAAFADFDLIRVVVDKASTKEIATDLGNITTLAGTTNNTVGGSFLTAGGFTAANFANLSVQYFAVQKGTGLNGTMWIGVGSSYAGTPQTGGVGAIQNNYAVASTINSVNKYYNTLAPGAVAPTTVVADNTNVSSFTGINGSTTLGSYKGFTGLWSTYASQSLAGLTSAAPLSMTVWQFGNNGLMTGAKNGVNILTLATNADGTTTINAQAASSVPVPAALYLMGSGLLGLVGMRRRNKA